MEDYFDPYNDMDSKMFIFEKSIRRSEIPFDCLYRDLQAIIPRNSTVNSLKTLKEVVDKAPPKSQDNVKELIKALYDAFHLFTKRIYPYLIRDHYDPTFVQLMKDLQVKKGGRARGSAQGLPPDLVKDVGDLCRQLISNVNDLEGTVDTWTKLLEQGIDIDPHHCTGCQNILRLVQDLYIESIQAFKLAKAWLAREKMIRHKLAWNPTSESGLSPTSQADTPVAASKPPKQKDKQRDHQVTPKQPATRKKKVKSLEEMDVERTSHVRKPTPPNSQKNPGSQDRRTKLKSSDQSQGLQNDPNQDPSEEGTAEEEQSTQGQPTTKRQQQKPNDRAQGNKAESPTDDPSEATEDRDDEAAAGQKTDSKMSKRQKKARPTVGNAAGAPQRDEESQEKSPQPDYGMEANDDGDDASVTITQLPDLKTSQRNKKKRDLPSGNKSSADDDNSVKMPPIHSDSSGKDRRKAPVQSKAKDTPTRKPVGGIKATESSVEALPLEQDVESKEDESRDQVPLSWQEKKLEKLRQKQEELIESKESQRGALKLLTAMKDNLAKEIAKYRGSYRLKTRLQARVTLLTEKAQGWKEETKLLDYEHQLLAEDMGLEIRLNGNFYRFIDKLKDRIAYLDDVVQEERLGIDELVNELGTMKETTDQMLYYGLPYDSELEALDMEFSMLGKYGYGYGYGHGYRGYGDLGGSLPSLKSYQFLRDEELLLGRSLRNRYERSIWDALKWDSADSMSLLSLEDSFGFPSRASDESADGARASKQRGDPGREDPGEYDSLADSEDQDEDEDEDEEQRKQPQMYDQKRNEKQPPNFVPI